VVVLRTRIEGVAVVLFEAAEGTQQSETRRRGLRVHRTTLEASKTEANYSEGGVNDAVMVNVLTHLSVQVMTGTILQQSFIIEYVVNNFMCPDCHKVRTVVYQVSTFSLIRKQVEANIMWTAVAQVRQRVE
jgi:hypothetical protein